FIVRGASRWIWWLAQLSGSGEDGLKRVAFILERMPMAEAVWYGCSIDTVDARDTDRLRLGVIVDKGFNLPGVDSFPSGLMHQFSIGDGGDAVVGSLPAWLKVMVYCEWAALVELDFYDECGLATRSAVTWVQSRIRVPQEL